MACNPITGVGCIDYINQQSIIPSKQLNLDIQNNTQNMSIMQSKQLDLGKYINTQPTTQPTIQYPSVFNQQQQITNIPNTNPFVTKNNNFGFKETLVGDRYIQNGMLQKGIMNEDDFYKKYGTSLDYSNYDPNTGMYFGSRKLSLGEKWGDTIKTSLGLGMQGVGLFLGFQQLNQQRKQFNLNKKVINKQLEVAEEERKRLSELRKKVGNYFDGTNNNNN